MGAAAVATSHSETGPAIGRYRTLNSPLATHSGCLSEGPLFGRRLAVFGSGRTCLSDVSLADRQSDGSGEARRAFPTPGSSRAFWVLASAQFAGSRAVRGALPAPSSRAPIPGDSPFAILGHRIANDVRSTRRGVAASAVTGDDDRSSGRTCSVASSKALNEASAALVRPCSRKGRLDSRSRRRHLAHQSAGSPASASTAYSEASSRVMAAPVADQALASATSGRSGQGTPGEEAWAVVTNP